MSSAFLLEETSIGKRGELPKRHLVPLIPALGSLVAFC